MMHYGKFFAMTAVSGLVMYAVMYLHTYAWDHVFYSQTRMWMTLLMVSTMMLIMLSFMLNMYKDKKINLGIYAGATVLFLTSLYFVRSQSLVDDIAYLRAMIPHHSIAILTSERANISDPRVRELADEIIKAQRKEIDEMKMLIKDLENRE